MKATAIREAHLGASARVVFTEPTVTVSRGTVRIITSAALPIRKASKVVAVKAA